MTVSTPRPGDLFADVGDLIQVKAEVRYGQVAGPPNTQYQPSV